MLWFIVNWAFAWLVGSLLAYVVLKKTNGQNVLPFDLPFWSTMWVPGAIGAFVGTALGELIAMMIG